MFEQLNVLGGLYERFQCFCWVCISMKLFLNIDCYLYEVIFEKLEYFWINSSFKYEISNRHYPLIHSLIITRLRILFRQSLVNEIITQLFVAG